MKLIFLSLSFLFFFWAWINPHYKTILITIGSIFLVILYVLNWIEILKKLEEDEENNPNNKMATANLKN